MTPEETLDWLAQQHFDQCREERPIQDWIRKMKSQLPPQRTWAGLTVSDKMAFLAQDFGGNRLDAMDWAEERLKEKNT